MVGPQLKLCKFYSRNAFHNFLGDWDSGRRGVQPKRIHCFNDFSSGSPSFMLPSGEKPIFLLFFCNDKHQWFQWGISFPPWYFFIVLTFSYREAVPSLPLSNYCDAFYWLLSLPLWSIWHLIEGRSPLIKGTSTTGRDGNFFVILVSFVILFHCRCDQFQF